jgi:hypothetical protein
MDDRVTSAAVCRMFDLHPRNVAQSIDRKIIAAGEMVRGERLWGFDEAFSLGLWGEFVRASPQRKEQWLIARRIAEGFLPHLSSRRYDFTPCWALVCEDPDRTEHTFALTKEDRNRVLDEMQARGCRKVAVVDMSVIVKRLAIGWAIANGKLSEVLEVFFADYAGLPEAARQELVQLIHEMEQKLRPPAEQAREARPMPAARKETVDAD